MSDPNSENCLMTMKTKIGNATVNDWNDISAFLSRMVESSPPVQAMSKDAFDQMVRQGVAFLTYDFGIDGVSIEIAKYAASFESLFPQVPLHFIGGDFYDKADVVLKPHWDRFRIEGINGWSKWYGGEWFSKLYYEDMPEGSGVSKDVAVEMWRQASEFSTKLADYLCENNIGFLIPVNIPTNPGNFSIMLAMIMVTEGLGTYVLSSNHDFYWEGGKPASERGPGEEKGPRDHFFKNCGNAPFFSLFQRMYPWNGKRWIQVNINTPQTEELVNKFGFSKEKVFELGTSISDLFFEPYDEEQVRAVRKRMAYILSDGTPTINPIPIRQHLDNLDTWMPNQKPVVCAAEAGLTLDPAQDKTVYCLQPTRVIARKRIPWDLRLIKSLMHHDAFSSVFAQDSDYQLIFHITGPVPIEHRRDLEDVLEGYVSLVQSVAPDVARRVFIAFSVGNEDHPALRENNLKPLCIEEIYRLATAILFPSETEGRGLPIVESGACGVPIVCSRYYPEDVFAEVVGEHLEEEEQIQYILFPEGDLPESFLNIMTDLLLQPEKFEQLRTHNKKAVRLRYSTEMIKRKFVELIEALRTVK